MEEITAVHDADYVQQLKHTAENTAPTVVADFDDPDGFTYMTSTSYDDALKVIIHWAVVTDWKPSNRNSLPFLVYLLLTCTEPGHMCENISMTSTTGLTWGRPTTCRSFKNALFVCAMK